MRSSWLVVMVAIAVAPVTARAQAYIEKFIGWSKDNSFYAITEAGTDERDVPALCVSKRGVKPATWPKDIPLPADDDARGCTETLDGVFEGQDAEKLMTKVQALVVAPAGKPPHGETDTEKKVGDGSIVEVAISRGTKVLGRGYITLRDKTSALPDMIGTHWRADGLAVAVEAAYQPAADPGPGFGPPAYLVVIALDGSAASAPRPLTPREQSRAKNLEGMKLLKAGKLDEAQRQFTDATGADASDSLAQYNLASVASLRKDTNTAFKAIARVVDLASSDPEAKRALAHAKTDHDLDFVAAQSPYVAQLLGRPRTKGDDWCIAAEKRARDMNEGNFIALAEEIGPLVEPGAHGGIRGDLDPVFTCAVSGSHSQMSIELYVNLRPKGKPERIVTVAWEIFPDGLYDADAFLDDKHTKLLNLKSLARIAKISARIATNAKL